MIRPSGENSAFWNVGKLLLEMVTWPCPANICRALPVNTHTSMWASGLPDRCNSVGASGISVALRYTTLIGKDERLCHMYARKSVSSSMNCLFTAFFQTKFGDVTFFLIINVSLVIYTQRVSIDCGFLNLAFVLFYCIKCFLDFNIVEFVLLLECIWYLTFERPSDTAED